MKVHIDKNFLKQSVDFYIIDGDRYLVLIENGWKWVSFDREIKQAPSFSLQEQVAEALAPVLLDTLPPSGAQGRHLDDAIDVRDRLVAMMESTYSA